MDKLFTILYIDDEPINLMLFELNFKRDYKVIIAGNGDEALEKLKVNPDINIVISDMKMPGMNGLEFITKAKIDYPGPTYYILTGYDITGDIAEAINEKLIAKCFRKPFEIKEIKNSIEESCK